MNRRVLLAAAGTGLAWLAGCVGSPGAPVGTPTPTATPDGGRVGCPTFETVDRVVCYQDVDPDAEPMVLEPTVADGELPTATAAFTIANGTDRSFTTNFYAWRLWKLVDGISYYLLPQSWPEPAMLLEPGDGHEWTLRVDNTDLSEAALGHVRGTETLDVAGLGGGTYAFAIEGAFEGGDSVSFGARFSLAGAPLELTPGESVTGTEREGDTIVVQSNGTADGAFVVTRVDEAEEVRLVVIEQVIREPNLRNTLAFFEEGVRRVRLENPAESQSTFGADEPYVLEHEGQRYRIETEE